MSVILENVQPQEPQELQEQEPQEQKQQEPQEPQETQEPQEPQEPQDTLVPQPKRRGRPKKADVPVKAPPPAAPKKAVRIPKPKSDSDEEPIDRDDMETMLMKYLLQRKPAQQNARRTMWAQMAGLS